MVLTILTVTVVVVVVIERLHVEILVSGRLWRHRHILNQMMTVLAIAAASARASQIVSAIVQTEMSVAHVVFIVESVGGR